MFRSLKHEGRPGDHNEEWKWAEPAIHAYPDTKKIIKNKYTLFRLTHTSHIGIFAASFWIVLCNEPCHTGL